MAKEEIIFRETPDPPGYWLVVPLERGWVAEYRLEFEQGRSTVFAELRVRPAGKLPKGGLDAALTRLIRVGEHRQLLGELLVVAIAKAVAAGETITIPAAWFRGRMPSDYDLAELAEAARSRGTRGDAYFAKIAARYSELVAAGNRRPAPIIAAELGQTRSYVTSVVSYARKLGLLTSTTRGRAGGRLTQKARRLLDREGGGTT